MKRDEKEKQIEELREKFSTAKVGILTEYAGLTVEDMTAIRRKLRTAKGELRVVKNTLAVRAAAGTPFGEASSAFVGPIAVALGYGDPVPTTKVVNDFSEEKDNFKIKIGVIEGRVIDSKDIKYVAKLPGKETLIAHFVSQLQAPVTGLVFVLQGVLQQFVGVLESIREKKGPVGE